MGQSSVVCGKGGKWDYEWDYEWDVWDYRYGTYGTYGTYEMGSWEWDHETMNWIMFRLFTPLSHSHDPISYVPYVPYVPYL